MKRRKPSETMDSTQPRKTEKSNALSEPSEPTTLTTKNSPPSHLLTYSELPLWLRDNAYILTSYRPPSNSVTTSLFSIFSLHNETINIHTHLLGALLFLTLSISTSPLPLPSPPFLNLTLPPSLPPLLPFHLGAITCLTLSAFYHTTSNVSPLIARYGNQADYIGILALITGSFIPSIHYAFHCHPSLRNSYWAMILSLAFACGVVTLNPRFRTPAWRAWRAGMFVAMGLSAVFPVLHGVVMYGVRDMERRIGLWWLVGQGALYIAGAGVYAARVPERWYPRKFDVVGSSHQIFHVAVVLAAGVHLVGLMVAAEHAEGEGGRCEDVL